MNNDDSGVVDYFTACHQSLAAMLPGAVDDAIRVYKELAGVVEKDRCAKDHQLHQAACKAALQHIELLMKLAATSGGQKPKTEHTDIADLMAKADDELNAYQTTTTDNERKRSS